MTQEQGPFPWTREQPPTQVPVQSLCLSPLGPALAMGPDLSEVLEEKVGAPGWGHVRAGWASGDTRQTQWLGLVGLASSASSSAVHIPCCPGGSPSAGTVSGITLGASVLRVALRWSFHLPSTCCPGSWGCVEELELPRAARAPGPPDCLGSSRLLV